ncbi:chitin synthase [Teratosphaeria nubilosa]|uniref:chitin synthase n=1 Tax=Teratosphaeria nubilosa TaxID=161662 RepID=A0A6G1LHY1_9PEZI|nr:chitin synthase [Teratosphaeria nubilosa]
MANRFSHHSSLSTAPRTNTMQNNAAQQMSTTSCLNALHAAYTSAAAYPLESSTALVVNTWLTALQQPGGTVDTELARRAFEHAVRRAEDGVVVLGSLHASTPSLLAPFVEALPVSVPGSFFTALAALRPFLHTVTPGNPSQPRYSALQATFNLNLQGDLSGASLALSTSGLDTRRALLHVENQEGHRAFDVFYYLLQSASAQEAEALGLKRAEQYALLRKSETYAPPSYLPTADDAANAEDWRAALKSLGIRGAGFRNLLQAVAAVLRLGDAVGWLVSEAEVESACDDVAELLEIDSGFLVQKLAGDEREVLAAGLYEAIVDWLVAKANQAIRVEIHTGKSINSSSGSEGGCDTPPSTDDDDGVSISIIEIPSESLGKAVALKTVFDDNSGINVEMKEDGVPVNSAGSSTMKAMSEAVAANEADLGIMGGLAGREREEMLDARNSVLEKIGEQAHAESFVRQILYSGDGQQVEVGKRGRFQLMDTLGRARVWFQLCLHPSDDKPQVFAEQSPTNLKWSAGSVAAQIRNWRLAEWANHRNKHLDYTADFDHEEFVERYSRLGCYPGKEGAEMWIVERGWSNGEVVIGNERIWMRENAWWEAETMLDMKPVEDVTPMLGGMVGAGGMESGYSVQTPAGINDGYFAPQYDDSKENLLGRDNSQSRMGARSLAPSAMNKTMKSLGGGDYGLGFKGDDKHHDITYDGEIDPMLAEDKHLEMEEETFGRRAWVFASKVVTFPFLPWLLKHIGRMKRPDIRQAWREKVLLMFIIFLINGIVVFYIVAFGKLLCPNYDKAWSAKQVGYHAAGSDFYVSHMGSVYDLKTWWKTDHTDGSGSIETSSTNMEMFGGEDVTEYIVPPLTIACPGLVTDTSVVLQSNTTLLYPNAEHKSGHYEQADSTSALYSWDWYRDNFVPTMKGFYKGQLVIGKKHIKKDGQDNSHEWFIIDGKVYDLTDYFYTKKLQNDLSQYSFMGDEVEKLVQNNPGGDLTKDWNDISNVTLRVNGLNCLNNRFLVGHTDFRQTPRCQVNNYILLAFTVILCAVILTKFLAALQFGGKKRPTQQDKFVICQVPAYTEGEDSLRKGLDSLTALQYDNKRKLLCVICDGMIVGGGNDRPTPKIVLDILGVDPKVDPPALPFKSVGVGAEQLNYGKVYSGLYEYEGNVVPYLVVVKVGKESEQTKSKPGNRGKRDSQILLMSFLNRVHHRAPMNPLELEMFHQINNVIGVDPELYEYLFMVDADTKVKEDSLNRLVSACANDAKIVGICGETSLENEERSWWTMIQVYEYYISHHLAKAFESLFGSVTCLPGCFCMYRLRTADKGRPLIISDKVIHEYADNNIDTLHKKNLLSLGEDRYLTTLMTKHFPAMSYKFIPDAYALTEAPAQWSVLLSQRRRWINSTIHNLAELVFLKDLCGFCCFSMRFVVFIDLFGTIILPATCVYLVYLVTVVSLGDEQFPLISIVMLGGVYGLQALIFLLKRQWQHIGWMIIYLLAYPIYSFILPVYSFWKQDDFSWGNTRVVVEEKGVKKVVLKDDEGFDPRSIPLQRWDDYAAANGLPGRRGLAEEKESVYRDLAPGNGYEMDEMKSVYSGSQRFGAPPTVLSGLHPQGGGGAMYHRPPQGRSPSPYNALNRQSTFSRYTDHPGLLTPHPHQPYPHPADQQRLMSMHSDPHHHQPQQQQQAFSARSLQHASRPGSVLPGFQSQGPSRETVMEAIRECFAEVDMESVTKKQMKALVEGKLQCQLVGEKRVWLDEGIDEVLGMV